ncbi:hypothetical protein Btru_065883 [Bulinus truncatus]|nr:hypothetical protein Btru_065883 [Bulinus truncatus]
MNSHTVLLSIVLVFIYLNKCSAIYCYVCNSMILPACGDQFTISQSDSKLRSWCDGSCIKRRGTRYGVGDVRQVEVIRGCILRRAEGCYSDNFNSLNMNACTCNTDFCNISPEIKCRKSFLFINFCIFIFCWLFFWR